MKKLASMPASLTGIGGAEPAPATTTRSRIDQQDSPLFSIPIELREIIYTHVLTFRRHLLDPTQARWQDDSTMALLRTCRRIHNEARLHVHFDDTYVFSTPEAAKVFLGKSGTPLQDLNLVTNETQDWTRCETWFDAWRGFLLPVPGRDHDAAFDLNIALPQLDTLTLDLVPLARSIHAQKPSLGQLRSIATGPYDVHELEPWVYSAGAMNNGLLFILYAISHALNGVLLRPTWLQTSTIIRIIGLSAEDASSVVEVDLATNVESINKFMGLARDRNGFCPSARLTGPGRYLLAPEEEVDPAGVRNQTVSANLRRDSLSEVARASRTA